MKKYAFFIFILNFIFLPKSFSIEEKINNNVVTVFKINIHDPYHSIKKNEFPKDFDKKSIIMPQIKQPQSKNIQNEDRLFFSLENIENEKNQNFLKVKKSSFKK